MTDLASETDTLTAGTAGSLWSAAEVLILLFGLVGIWPTSFFSPSFPLRISLPPPGFHFTSVFSPLASYSFIWLKCLSLTLKLATKRQENSIARCSIPD